LIPDHEDELTIPQKPIIHHKDIGPGDHPSMNLTLTGDILKNKIDSLNSA